MSGKDAFLAVRRCKTLPVLAGGLVLLAGWMGGCARPAPLSPPAQGQGPQETAGQPENAAAPAAEVLLLATPAPADTLVEMQVEGRVATLDIFSPKGIGSVQVVQASKTRPAQVIIRLHVEGLEHLEFAYGDTLTTVSISSRPDNTVRQYRCPRKATGECQGDSPGTALSSDDPHWLAVRIFAEDGTPGTIPLKNGWIEIRLPNPFFQSKAQEFELRWIDFYR